MNQQAMEPFGKALLDYFKGNSKAELIFIREDGQRVAQPVNFFFRDQSNFTSIEKTALNLCIGHVLDIGAGTGSQSISLSHLNYTVTSIDICPHAVTIMKERGLKNVYCADIFDFKSGPFDTLLMMGHGIGLVETITGLDKFLVHAQNLISANGQILLDSLDVRKTVDPVNLKYHETNRKAGRYIGEIRMKFEFQNQVGPYCGWLQIDAEKLKEHAELAGWQYETICEEKSGDYLARLTKKQSL